MAIVFLVMAIFCASAGQVLYKAFTSNRKYSFLALTIALFLLTPLFSYLALKELTIDIVYVATSMNSIIILLMTSLFLRESVTTKQYLGAIITTVGVAVYAL